ncbi:molybdopterin-synthase adenylyltransferase MoeB ['Osedax' symbiont bacterium Rs2_46_30_T18]|nr:molybdopterin-synthase adenylyltransferase MoeB ['Osedax' symbiont bacterium Rs2_46_30_T18]
MLTDDQLLRYSRQIMLADIDIAGQEALQQARVLIVGLGGLGSPVAMYLAAAGVGELILVDDDSVELSNLQRQVIHHSNCLGVAKVDSAAQRIESINPHVRVQCVSHRLESKELLGWLEKVDLLVDCSDNFSTRFMLNRCCVAQNTPLVSGAAIRMEGQLLTVDPRVESSPCYQCLYPEAGDDSLSCAESGVLAPVVGVIGSMQALEAIKVLTGVGETLVGRLMIFDAKNMQWQTLKLKADANCPVCSTR